jgi:hypothetical protein
VPADDPDQPDEERDGESTMAKTFVVGWDGYCTAK